jgi:hypothetical protein
MSDKPYHYGPDRYAWQLQRQNQGLTCSDCGSSLGHFGFCALLRYSEDKPQPDSQSFYSKAQEAIAALRIERIAKQHAIVEQTMHDQGYMLSPDGYTWVKRGALPVSTPKPANWVPEFSEEDRIRIYGMGVTLDDTRKGD